MLWRWRAFEMIGFDLVALSISVSKSAVVTGLGNEGPVFTGLMGLANAEDSVERC
jgi:hypothetical protein